MKNKIKKYIFYLLMLIMWLFLIGTILTSCASVNMITPILKGLELRRARYEAVYPNLTFHSSTKESNVIIGVNDGGILFLFHEYKSPEILNKGLFNKPKKQ